MVYLASFLGAAAICAQFVNAVPMVARDSSQNEPAVKAPDGTPITQTSDAKETGMSSSSGYGSSGSGSSGYGSSGSGSSGYGSSDSSSSGYGSKDSGSSGYGSKDSGSSSYGSNNYDSSSSSLYQSTYAATSTQSSYSAEATSSSSYSMPSYGSGSSSYNSGSYNSCVQQCMASYAPPMGSMDMPSSTASSSSGSGATHMVIVAPSQGVLRFVPPILNASVGDTVKFMWGANNHTVTKSSELTPCNKSSDSPFASGVQNKSFEFDQVINSTDTTFFYCGVPTHCQKGMFGIINPPNTDNLNSSAGAMMSSMMQSMSSSMNSSMDSNMSSMYNMMMASQAMAGNSSASSWGSNLDMSGMPSWAQPLMMENIAFTRMFLAANPETLQSDGSVNLMTNSSAPLMIPADVSNNAANSTSTSSSSGSSGSTPAATSSAAATSSSSSAAPAGAASKNGAGALATPRALIGVVAVLATFFAL